MQKSIIKGYVYVILSAVIFGLMPLMAKHIYSDGVNPPTLVFLRNAISLPILAALIFLTKNSIKVPLGALPKISIIATMGCALTPLLLFSSYNHIPSGTATVFHFIYPAATLIGEFIFLKAKFKAGHVISIILCVAGIAMFYNPNDKINFLGGLFALLSGLTYAIYIILLAGFKHKNLPGFTFSFYVASVSAVLMLIFCLCSGNLALPESFDGWLLTTLFAACINVGAVVLFQKGTFLIGGGRASILSAFEPITSVFVAFCTFESTPGFFNIGGTLLVISATVIIALSDIKESKSN